MNSFVHFVTMAMGAAALCLPAIAHETEQKVADPGFRPESEHSAAFLDAVKPATIAVHPTIVRTIEGTTFSRSSQQTFVSALNEHAVTTAVTDTTVIDPGELKGNAQWDMFQNDLQVIGDAVKKGTSDADYSLILEVLLSPPRSGGFDVFGIHCILTDRQGRNAFSFLLNSHHQLLVDAKLRTDTATEADREALVMQATRVAVTALIEQIRFAERLSGK